MCMSYTRYTQYVRTQSICGGCKAVWRLLASPPRLQHASALSEYAKRKQKLASVPHRKARERRICCAPYFFLKREASIFGSMKYCCTYPATGSAATPMLYSAGGSVRDATHAQILPSTPRTAVQGDLLERLVARSTPILSQSLIAYCCVVAVDLHHCLTLVWCVRDNRQFFAPAAGCLRCLYTRYIT